MGKFEERKARGLPLEARVIQILEQLGCAVAVNGTEHTHPEFADQLRTNSTSAAKFIRFAPDGVCQTAQGQVVHFDSKASNAIERDAWEVYQAYEGAGCSVVLWMEPPQAPGPGKLFRQFLPQIGFLDSDEVVGRYTRPFPVEDGWICPRLRPGFVATAAMSGAAHKRVDFTTMVEWKEE